MDSKVCKACGGYVDDEGYSMGGDVEGEPNLERSRMGQGLEYDDDTIAQGEGPDVPRKLGQGFAAAVARRRGR